MSAVRQRYYVQDRQAVYSVDIVDPAVYIMAEDKFSEKSLAEMEGVHGGTAPQKEGLIVFLDSVLEKVGYVDTEEGRLYLQDQDKFQGRRELLLTPKGHDPEAKINESGSNVVPPAPANQEASAENDPASPSPEFRIHTGNTEDMDDPVKDTDRERVEARQKLGAEGAENPPNTPPDATISTAPLTDEEQKKLDKDMSPENTRDNRDTTSDEPKPESETGNARTSERNKRDPSAARRNNDNS